MRAGVGVGGVQAAQPRRVMVPDSRVAAALVGASAVDELLTRCGGAGPADELLLEAESLLDAGHQLWQQGSQLADLLVHAGGDVLAVLGDSLGVLQ
ncbi:hypothetical protein [Streptomyces tubercidicus]